ncbi:hypothetical protein NC653_005807 [Populus alba x Populus x berolinensis]|uniref:Uncharacterized protein n=1 Tax=Populus alba x Populus x berolinensis TaxID=444605 RepID=A0AAD6RD40_9ROSI|nr:hypothetical protein NC653_005807 [Populus alba x Populus x berolinensis]
MRPTVPAHLNGLLSGGKIKGGARMSVVATKPLQKWKVESRDDFKGEFRQGQGSSSDSLFIGKIFPTFLTLWIPSKPLVVYGKLRMQMNDGDERGGRESEAVKEGHNRGNATIMALERDGRDSQGPIQYEHFVIKFQMDGPCKHFTPGAMAFVVLTVSLYQKTFSVTVKSSSTSTIIKNYNLDPFRSITVPTSGGYMMTAKGKEEGTPQTASHPKPICQQPKEEHKPN